MLLVSANTDVFFVCMCNIVLKKLPSDIQRSYFIRELESAAEDRIEITR